MEDDRPIIRLDFEAGGMRVNGSLTRCRGPQGALLSGLFAGRGRIHWLDCFLLFDTWRAKQRSQDYWANLLVIRKRAGEWLPKIHKGITITGPKKASPWIDLTVPPHVNLICNITDSLDSADTSQEAFIRRNAKEGWEALAIAYGKYHQFPRHLCQALLFATIPPVGPNYTRLAGSLRTSLSEYRDALEEVIEKFFLYPPKAKDHFPLDWVIPQLQQWILDLVDAKSVLKYLETEFPKPMEPENQAVQQFHELLVRYSELTCDTTEENTRVMGGEVASVNPPENDILRREEEQVLIEIMKCSYVEDSIDRLDRDYSDWVEKTGGTVIDQVPTAIKFFVSQFSRKIVTGSPIVTAAKFSRYLRHHIQLDRLGKSIPSMEASNSADLQTKMKRLRELLDSLESRKGAKTAITKMHRTMSGARSSTTPQKTKDLVSWSFLHKEDRFFGGRQKEIEALNAFLEQENENFFFVTGPSGSGKTALLLNWSEGLVTNPGVVRHFITPRVPHGREEKFVFYSLCHQLASFHGLSTKKVPVDELGLRSFYADLLMRPSPSGRKLIVVLDGLDETLGHWTPGPDMFPHRLPKDVRVVFSARQMAEKDWLQDLGLPIPERFICTLKSLTRDDIDGLVHGFPGLVPQESNRSRIVDRLFQLSEGDPFYLHDLLIDLENAHGDINALANCPIGHNRYLQRWWTDGQAHHGGRAFEDLMGSLAVARSPLSRDILIYLSRKDRIRGGNFRPLIQKASRYLVGNETEGYSLSHPRIAEFVVQEMTDEIDEYRACFADFCLRWRDDRMPSKAKDYIFRHGPEHLVAVGRIDELLAMLNPAWFQAKGSRFGYSSVMVHDLQTAVTACRKREPTEDHVAALFRLAWQKDILQPASKIPLLGAEQAIRVRMGQWQRALDEVSQFGDVNDRLGVAAELLVCNGKQERAAGRALMQALVTESALGAPEALEHAAIRIATTDPKVALDLARRIPSPEYLLDRNGSEVSNRWRGIFRTFRQLARTDLEKALTVMDSLDGGLDEAQASLAIGEILIRQSDPRVIPLLTKSVAQIKDEGLRERAKLILTRYLFSQIRDLPPELMGRSLHLLNAFRPFLDQIETPADLFDQQINEDPARWLAVANALPPGVARDFIRWRLFALGHKPLDDAASFEPSSLRDRVQAECWVKVAANDPSRTVQVVADFESLPGHVRLITGIARRLAERDQTAAQHVVLAAFEGMVKEPSEQTLFEILDLARVQVAWPGKTRARILTWCMDQMDQLPLQYMRADAMVILGIMLADGWATSRPYQNEFFRRLLLEFPTESQRKTVALALFTHLPVALCSEAAKMWCTLGFESDGDRAILLPETQALVLVHLSARLSKTDQGQLTGLLTEAAEQLSRVPDDEARKTLGVDLMGKVLKIDPALIGLIGQHLADPAEALDLALKNVFQEAAVATTDRIESSCRFALLLFHRIGVNPAMEVLLTNQAFQQLGGRDGLALSDPGLGEGQDGWVRRLLTFLAGKTCPFGNERGLALDGVVEPAAELDWQGLMDAINQPDFCRHSLVCLNMNRLALRMIELEELPDRLLADLEVLRCRLGFSNQSAAKKDMYIRNNLSAQASAFDPDTCINLVARRARQHRRGFIRHLENLSPRIPWSEIQVVTLFDHLNLSGNCPDDLVVGVNLLKWLGQTWALDGAVLSRYLQAVRNGPVTKDLVSVAIGLASINPAASVLVIKRTLELALQQNDSFLFFNVLREFAEVKNPKDPGEAGKREVVEAIREWLSSPPGRDYRKWTTSAAAFRFLRKSRFEGPSQVECTLDALAQVATVHDDADVRRWAEELHRFEGVEPAAQGHFIATLISRAIAAGAVRSLDTSALIADATARTRTVLALLKHDDDETQRITLERWIGEIDRLASEDQEWPFRILAEWFATQGSPRAVAMYQKVLDAAAQGGNVIHFMSTVEQICDQCLVHSRSLSQPLATVVHDAVRKFPFAEENWLLSDARLGAMLSVISIYWALDDPQGVQMLHGLLAKYRPVLERPLTFGPRGVWDACRRVLITSGEERAVKLLEEIRTAVPEGSRTRFADALTEALFMENRSGRPLARYGIWDQGLSPEACLILPHLVPECSEKTAAEANFLMAISMFPSQRALAVHYLDQALPFFMKPRPSEEMRYEHNFWVCWAILHGARQIPLVFDRLFAVPDCEFQDLSGLLTFAVETAADPGAFLLKIWSPMTTILETI